MKIDNKTFNNINFINGDYLESMTKRPEIKIVPNVKLISYTPDADDVIIESYIMYHYQ